MEEVLAGLAKHDNEGWAVLDLDLVNCFGRFEWSAIRSAYDALMPEFAEWERWCTEEAAAVKLPSGEWVQATRGAGQGEPDGPLKAATVIAHCVQKAKQDLEKDGGNHKWSKAWYIDDGQLVMRPRSVEPVLLAID